MTQELEDIRAEVQRRIAAVIAEHGFNKDLLYQAFVKHFQQLRRIFLAELGYGCDISQILDLIDDIADIWWEDAELETSLVDAVTDELFNEIDGKDLYIDDFVVGE